MLDIWDVLKDVQNQVFMLACGLRAIHIIERLPAAKRIVLAGSELPPPARMAEPTSHQHGPDWCLRAKIAPPRAIWSGRGSMLTMCVRHECIHCEPLLTNKIVESRWRLIRRGG